MSFFICDDEIMQNKKAQIPMHTRETATNELHLSDWYTRPSLSPTLRDRSAAKKDLWLCLTP